MGVSLRAVKAADQAVLRQWAKAVSDGMSRTRPLAEAADRHDPATGLYWYVIAADDRDVGTVWIELPPPGSEGVLGIFLGDAADRGHGVGAAAVKSPWPSSVARIRSCPWRFASAARTSVPSPAIEGSVSWSPAMAPRRCRLVRSCRTTAWCFPRMTRAAAMRVGQSGWKRSGPRLRRGSHAEPRRA